MNITIIFNTNEKPADSVNITIYDMSKESTIYTKNHLHEEDY